MLTNHPLIINTWYPEYEITCAKFHYWYKNVLLGCDNTKVRNAKWWTKILPSCPPRNSPSNSRLKLAQWERHLTIFVAATFFEKCERVRLILSTRFFAALFSRCFSLLLRSIIVIVLWSLRITLLRRLATWRPIYILLRCFIHCLETHEIVFEVV